MEINEQLHADLLAKNLRRVDQLPRRGLLRFLDKETSKSSTEALRKAARKWAIYQAHVMVDMELARIEQDMGLVK